MSNPDRAEEIVDAALDLPAEERAAYLDRNCADDIALRQLVDALLQAHQRAPAPRPHAAAPRRDEVASSSASVSEKPGDRIGRYKLLQQVGEGGCGVVYMAEQEEPVRRRVALKVIKLGMDTKQVIARFEAERQALALMDHPNIAKVHDGGATDAGRPYFVMELVRGIKITDYCDQNNLPTAKRLALFIQVCHAIQHAHQKGIIHRDVKPSNILVTMHDGAPVPKVIDFGIAKATEPRVTDKTLSTALEQFIGTPAYMSPEQAEITGLDIDTRSDIYSLGVLLYELLTGQMPFDPKDLRAAGLAEMRRIIREQDPVKPSTRLSSLSAAAQTTAARRRQVEAPRLMHLLRGDLDWIVMKCLEKDRTRRYETANGLAGDVRRHLNSEPVTASPPSAAYRLGKLVRRNKVAFTAASIVVGALIIGFGLSTWLFVQERAARQQAKAEAAKSKQVARFLENMLAGVGPSFALGRDTTMLREILDKTVQQVGRDLTNQPEVEAELRVVLGSTYADLAQFTNAVAMLQEALRLSRSGLSEDNVRVAAILSSSGVIFQRMGDLHAAEVSHREAMAIRKRLLGSDNLDVAESAHNLATVLYIQGKRPEAESMLRETLAIQRKRLGNENLNVAMSLNNLANMIVDRGELDAAEALFREALGILKKLQGNESPRVAMALDNLGSVLLQRGDLTNAEAMHREALAMRRKLFHDAHPEIADSLGNLASVLKAWGDLAGAEPLYREALAMDRNLLGEVNPAVAALLNNLADLLKAKEDLTGAETLFRESLAMKRKLYGEPHPGVADALSNLGATLFDKGDFPGAEEYYHQALAMRNRLFPDQHPDVILSRKQLALLFAARGDLKAAVPAMQEVLAAERKLFGNENIDVAESLDKLAQFLSSQGNLPEAESSSRECLAIREKLIPDHWAVSSARSSLGSILAGQKRYGEAEPFLLSGYAGLTQRTNALPNESKVRLKETGERIVQLYDAWSKPDQSAAWRARLASNNVPSASPPYPVAPSNSPPILPSPASKP